MARIGVENSLSDIQQALQNSGHEIVALDENNAAECDCCVISGQDENMMGFANTVTQSSVINANGMSAQQVVEQVNQRLQQQ